MSKMGERPSPVPAPAYPAPLILFRSDEETPLGQVLWGGTTRVVGPFQHEPMHILGMFALIYVVRGHGTFRNATGYSQTLRPGDLIMLFPDVAHAYGPTAGEDFEEFFVTFNGPLFQLWRQCRLLDPEQPVCHLDRIEYWAGKLRGIVSGAPSVPAEAFRYVARLFDFLSEVQVALRAQEQNAARSPWLGQARLMLGENLHMPLNGNAVAKKLGVPYDTFRRQFRQETGISPARFRMNQRIATAADLLLHTPLNVKQIAESLGFVSEFHFSQRFKDIKGVSPRTFRERAHHTEVVPEA